MTGKHERVVDPVERRARRAVLWLIGCAALYGAGQLSVVIVLIIKRHHSP